MTSHTMASRLEARDANGRYTGCMAWPSVGRCAPLLVTLALGCGDGEGDGADPIPELLEELRIKRESWIESQPAGYVFIAAETCSCSQDDLRGIRTSVRDGAVVSAIGVSSGLPQAEGGDLTALFDGAIAAAEENPDSFDVAYDDTYGFLQHYSVDFDAQSVDDELVRGVVCFSDDVSNDQCPVATRTREWCTANGGRVAPVDAAEPRATCDRIPESETSGQFQASGSIAGAESVCCLPVERSFEVIAMEIDEQL